VNLAIEYRPIDNLIPYARNARTHSEQHVAQIAASIKEFGWTNPVLVDGANGLIAGHGRVLAARELGMTEVPCVELAGLSAAQRRAYILADNKLALNAGWDDTLLSLELGDLKDAGFDLGLVGFSDGELTHILEGWNSDIQPADAAHTDGITTTVKVTVEQADVPKAKEVITLAMEAAGIEFAVA
jgi:ParB-like chromosome segregation protein Spo0J